jgi:hypothetical protein
MKRHANANAGAEADRAEAELRHQLLLIESMLREGFSEREITAALERD